LVLVYTKKTWQFWLKKNIPYTILPVTPFFNSQPY